ncbi:MAG: glycoside hydrolase family 28 protein [Bacteroidaceae bacterium]|nr:glycoside hydrolase family 28 protein [Bacteroidaceae bacterium]
MKKIILLLPFLLASLSIATAANGIYNVRDYGAKGDGKHIDSPAINAAIKAASTAGGGTVYLPAGTYLSYSIRLKSHTALYLEQGSVLKATIPNDSLHYDLPEENPNNQYQDFGHSHWKNSLIWGIGLEDVSIRGFGLIDGTEGITRGQRRMNGHPSANKAIALKECRNVTIRDISMLRCGHFAMLLTGVDNLTIDNVRCDTNRDAFDIDCCANVRVSNCQVNTPNDDGIVLKCSYALGYAKPTEQVTITNCHVSGYDVGTLLDATYQKTQKAAPDRDGPTGRIKLGTESNGGFKNITISNCTFDHCRGLALETVDGAPIEDVTISNIAMRDICNSPIYIRLGNRARGPKELPVSTIRRVKLSNIVVKDADCRYASMIFGIEGHPIEDVTLSGIHIQYRGGITLDDVRYQRGTNPFFTRMNERVNDTTERRIRIEHADADETARDLYDVPQMEKGYPEPSSHGILPAYGLFVSHARNVTIDDIRLETLREDERPPVVLMDVEEVTLRHIKTDKAAAAPYVVAKEVKDLQIVDFHGIKDVKKEKVTDLEIKK